MLSFTYLIQLSVLVHQDLRIPRHGDEQGINSSGERDGEAVRNLQAYEEGVCYHDWSEVAVAVVGRVGEDDVNVGHQGAGVGDEHGAHGEDGADQAFVDERVDSPVFDHFLYMVSTSS